MALEVSDIEVTRGISLIVIFAKTLKSCKNEVH